MDFSIDNITRENEDHPMIENLVQIARENGIDSDDEKLYAFVKMVFNTGADIYALDTVAHDYNITHNYLDDYIPSIDEDGILDDNDMFQQFQDYVDKHIDDVRFNDRNIAEAKDFIFDAIVDYGNYRTDEPSLDLKIAEELFENFKKSINKQFYKYSLIGNHHVLL